MPSLKEDQRQTWLHRIEDAKGVQGAETPRWKEALDFLTLKWFEKRFPNEFEHTEVHWLWAYYNTIIPSLYARDPNVFVRPRQPRSTPFSQTMEEAVTFEIQAKRLKDYIQREIRDTVPYGIGYIEVGFQPEKKGEDENILSQIKDIFNQQDQAKKESEQPLTYLLPERQEGSIYLRWWPAFRVLLCPNYHVIREMPWIILIEDIEQEDLEKDPDVNQAIVKTLKPTRLTRQRSGLKSPAFSVGRLFQNASQNNDMIRLYHILDRRNRQKITFAEGESREISLKPWGSSLDEFFLIPLHFNQLPPMSDDAKSYPMDDVTPIKPLLIEMHLLRTSMIKARRRNAPMVIYDSNIVTKEEASKLSETEEAIIVGIPGGLGNMQSVEMIKIPDDCYRVNDLIRRDLETITGYSEMLISGQAPRGANTATEASLTAQGTSLRNARKIDIIEEHIMEIASKIGSLLWEHYDRDKISMILGKPVSQEMWPDLPPSKQERNRVLSEELQFKIDAGSSQPDQIRMVEANIKLRVVNMIKAAFPDRLYDDRLLKQLLKDTGFKEIEYLVRGFDEQETAIAQQENQLLLKNIPQLVSPNELHDIHIMQHGAAAQAQSTDAMDKHILLHQQFRQMNNPMKNPGTAPQKGDVSSPNQAVVPELQREGGENFSDLLGQGASIQQGLGPETGGGI